MVIHGVYSGSMCGRGRAVISHKQLLDIQYQLSQFNKNNTNNAKIKNNQNISCNIENLSPGMTTPIVYYNYNDKYIDCKPMIWGLIPSYHKEIKSSDYYKMFNARIETIKEKISFKHLINQNRCIVVFNGFYEWKSDLGSKEPYYITHVTDEPLLLAGLYTTNDESNIISYTILTCTPCKDMLRLHDRQPVILNNDQIADWLNPNNNSIDSVSNVLDRLILSNAKLSLKIYKVTKSMTNPNYQSINCSLELPQTNKLTTYFKTKRSDIDNFKNDLIDLTENDNEVCSDSTDNRQVKIQKLS